MVLVLSAPFLLLFVPGWSPFLLIIPGFWLIAFLARQNPIPRTPLNGALLVFGLMVLVSLYATYDIRISVPTIAGVVVGMANLFTIARYSQSAKGWWLSFLIFLLVGFVIAALGLVGMGSANKVGGLGSITRVFSLPLAGWLGRDQGFNPNVVAGALVWVIPVFLALAGFIVTRYRLVLQILPRGLAFAPVLVLGCAGFVSFVFLLAQSRGGYLGLFITTFVMLALILPPRWRGIFVSTGVIVVIIAGSAFLLYGGSIFETLELSSSAGDSSALAVDTLEGRLEVWSRAIYAIQDFPFTGMGMDAFRRVVHVLYPLFLIGPDVETIHAHNEFLQAALDLGIPGLIAFVALYLIAFWMLVHIWRAPSSAPVPWRLARFLALGLGGGLFAHLLYGLTDSTILSAKPGFIFWILLGLIAGLYDQTQSGELARTETRLAERFAPMSNPEAL